MNKANEIAEAETEVEAADTDIRRALANLSHDELVSRALDLFWEASQLRTRLQLQRDRNDSLRKILDSRAKNTNSKEQTSC